MRFPCGLRASTKSQRRKPSSVGFLRQLDLLLWHHSAVQSVPVYAYIHQLITTMRFRNDPQRSDPQQEGEQHLQLGQGKLEHSSISKSAHLTLWNTLELSKRKLRCSNKSRTALMKKDATLYLCMLCGVHTDQSERATWAGHVRLSNNA